MILKQLILFFACLLEHFFLLWVTLRWSQFILCTYITKVRMVSIKHHFIGRITQPYLCHFFLWPLKFFDFKTMGHIRTESLLKSACNMTNFYGWNWKKKQFRNILPQCVRHRVWANKNVLVYFRLSKMHVPTTCKFLKIMPFQKDPNQPLKNVHNRT